jgi:hypothetical protein
MAQAPPKVGSKDMIIKSQLLAARAWSSISDNIHCRKFRDMARQGGLFAERFPPIPRLQKSDPEEVKLFTKGVSP